MRHITLKREARERAAAPVRDALRERVGRCEVCGTPKMPNDLAVHEIANGPLRVKAIDKLFAVLVVCRLPNFRKQTDCHREVQEWPEPKQLALLYMRRSADYDLTAYLTLTNPRAMQRITQSEVDEQIQILLAGRATK